MKKSRFVFAVAFVAAFVCGPVSAMLGCLPDTLSETFTFIDDSAAFVTTLSDTNGGVSTLKATGGFANYLKTDGKLGNRKIVVFLERWNMGCLEGGSVLDLFKLSDEVSFTDAPYLQYKKAFVRVYGPFFKGIYDAARVAEVSLPKIDFSTVENIDRFVGIVATNAAQKGTAILEAAVAAVAQKKTVGQGGVAQPVAKPTDPKKTSFAD
ncbi:hypothetical protein FACS1894122_06170 [Alphaproteobacteria bacterium]|nr:hypothetical protein FACS1894122_06170 [Alphaproteobacteria bacterium]